AVNELGYRVHRATDGFDLSGNLAPGVTTWTQMNLGINTSQQVYVEVFNVSGGNPSGLSSQFYTLATTVTPSVDSIFTSSAIISWDMNNANPSGTLYELSWSSANFNSAIFTLPNLVTT